MQSAPSQLSSFYGGNLYGVRIVPHALAREIRDEWRVERHPTPKRRRRWRVVKHRIDRPGAWMTPDALYVHPDILAQLTFPAGTAQTATTQAL